MSHIYPDPMPTSFTAVGQTGPYQPQLQQQMSNQINNGGPAFPLQSIGPEFLPGYSGMTLRDYFAAAEKLDDLEHISMDGAVALAGPKPEGNWNTNPIEWRKWEARWRATVRFIRADAVLKAREVKL